MTADNSEESRRAAVGAMLGFAANLFRSPLNEAQRAYLAGLDLSVEDVVLGESACFSGLRKMQSFCTDGDLERVLHAASVAFHGMFVGPHHVTCPPWGSVHLDGGRLFGPSALEVARVFAARGFAIPEGKSEPSDHVAYELAFMSELLSAGDVVDCKEFATKYVEPWFGELASQVRENDATGFYDGLCDLTSGLLRLTMALSE